MFYLTTTNLLRRHYVINGVLLLVWILLAHALHSVLDLANQEVYFQRALGFRGLQVRHHDVGKYLTEMLHLGSLFFL